MPYEVREDVIDQIWRDLGQRIDRPRIAVVAHAIAVDLADARITGFVPLFVRRMACERLRREVLQQQGADAAPEAQAGHARCRARRADDRAV